MKFFFLFLISLMLLQCKEHKHDANAHMNSIEFDKLVERFESSERASWQKPDEVISVLELKKNMVVADLGAGTVYFSRRFARALTTGTLYALDVDEQWLNLLKKDAKKSGLKNYQVKKVGYQGEGIAQLQLDIFFLCNVYHHINERVAYFAKVKKSLRPDGRLVIVDFYKKETPIGPPVKHKMSKEKVASEMQQAGFSLAKTHSILPYQYILEFKSSQ